MTTEVAQPLQRGSLASSQEKIVGSSLYRATTVAMYFWYWACAGAEVYHWDWSVVERL